MFGETECAVRFFSALAGVSSILLVWHIGRKIYGRREGLLGALILGTSIGYLVQARLNIIDTTLMFFMTAALGSFLIASRDDEPSKRFYYYAWYACMALAVLSKGLIGIVLPGMIIFIYLLPARRWKLLKEMRLFPGIVLFLLITVPWFVLVSVRNPEFVGFFFIHEHLTRYLTTAHSRYQPSWFFIPILIGCMFPWSCFFPAAAASAIRGMRRRGADPDLFLAIWAVFIFCFFSISKSKLVPYILPVYPAVALLTGKVVSESMDRGFRSLRIEARFLQIILLVGAAATLLYPRLAPRPHLGPAGGEVYALFLLIGVLAVTFSMRRADLAVFFLGLCFIIYVLGIVGPKYIFDEVIQKRSLKELALIAKNTSRADDTICCYGFYSQDLPFYTCRRVICVDVLNDLALGSSQVDQSSWFIDYGAFYRLWDSPGRILTLIDTDDIADLRKSVTRHVRFLGRKGDKLIVSNR
ncbi:MAG: glycosyltransferase family 39 protein [Candidatus Aureabacteria bacterium]|nr:glycosyltransferase family 39 protein [Candidatus Auribacterota bacterium]